MDENITYDQLPVMSPMMASNSNDGNGGGHGQPIMEDGKLNIHFLYIVFRNSEARSIWISKKDKKILYHHIIGHLILITSPWSTFIWNRQTLVLLGHVRLFISESLSTLLAVFNVISRKFVHPHWTLRSTYIKSPSPLFFIIIYKPLAHLLGPFLY